MKHANGTCEIITQRGTDVIAGVETVDDYGWVNLFYLGEAGLIVSHSEWKAFVKLVKKIDAHIVDKG